MKLVSYAVFLWCTACLATYMMQGESGWWIPAWTLLMYVNAYEIAMESQT